jgi:Cu/Ag efflux protein CusF
MTRRIAWVVSSIGALTLAGCTTTQSPPEVAAAAPAVPTPVVSGTVAQNTVRVTATVEAIDLKNRMVTLKGPDGKSTKVHVDEQVRNLPQVKKGDQVVVTYYESLAFEVNRPGTGAPGVVVAEDVRRAQPGQRPGGTAAQAVTLTATIQAIDTKANTVTLKDPDGELTTIKVRDPSRLEKVKVGDLIDITYTEALAIAVEPPAK